MLLVGGEANQFRRQAAVISWNGTRLKYHHTPQHLQATPLEKEEQRVVGEAGISVIISGKGSSRSGMA